MHTGEKILSDIARLRKAGIGNINVDLIAGLPHQTRESWDYSLDQAIASGVPHVSIYMLEVDEDSRLGRELIAGGTKYHAHHVPDDDLTADFYETACARLNAAGIEQYEISNFARAGFESKHNNKYWTASHILASAWTHTPCCPPRRATMTPIVCGFHPSMCTIAFSPRRRFRRHWFRGGRRWKRVFFLGLRLNRGVDLNSLRLQYGEPLDAYMPAVNELVSEGLLARSGDNLRLTPGGRLLSNEVFEKFVGERVST